jgi:hypothetical protein
MSSLASLLKCDKNGLVWCSASWCGRFKSHICELYTFASISIPRLPWYNDESCSHHAFMKFHFKNNLRELELEHQNNMQVTRSLHIQ